MRVIYGFSAQTGVESTTVSNNLSGKMVRLVDFLTGHEKTAEEVQELANFIETGVRKAAHGAEYAVLALLLYAHLSIYGVSLGTKAFLSWLISTVYAFTDEYHQTLIDGRSASLKDVAIDSVGAALVLFVILMVAANRQSRKVYRLEDEKWEARQRAKEARRRENEARRRENEAGNRTESYRRGNEARDRASEARYRDNEGRRRDAEARNRDDQAGYRDNEGWQR